MTGLQHIQRAHRQHLASQVRPPPSTHLVTAAVFLGSNWCLSSWYAPGPACLYIQQDPMDVLSRFLQESPGAGFGCCECGQIIHVCPDRRELSTGFELLSSYSHKILNLAPRICSHSATWWAIIADLRSFSKCFRLSWTQYSVPATKLLSEILKLEADWYVNIVAY